MYKITLEMIKSWYVGLEDKKEKEMFMSEPLLTDVNT